MSNQIGSLKMGQKFKKTPAGEIPVDWGVTTFGDSFDFLRTANNSREDLNSIEGVGYLHYGDIHTKWKTKLQCDRIELPKIFASKVEKIPFLKDGDLVMADASEDYDGIGIAVEVSGIGNQCAVAGLHTILLRDKGNRFVDGFRGYIQYVPVVHHNLIKIATGGSVYGISKGNLSGVPIPCPPLSEQRKIANILSDVDNVVNLVTEEIETTKELKKGLMCQLLTCGIPGTHQKFKKSKAGCIPVEWRDLPMKSFLQPRIGIKPGPFGSSLKKSFYTNDGFRVYGQEQVIAGDLTVGDYYVSKEKYSEMEMFAVQENDILLSLVGTTGRVLVVRKPFHPGIINPRLIRLRVNSDIVDVEYFKHLLMFEQTQSQLAQLSQGGTMGVLSGTVLRQLILPCPGLPEQKEISQLLDSIDIQIVSHQNLLGRIQALKAGLIRILLTGKVRVVV